MPASGGDRTEQPTQRRLQQAREKGQFPASREFVGGVQFVAVAALISAFGVEAVSGLRTMLRQLLHTAFQGDLTHKKLEVILLALATQSLSPLMWAGAALVGVSIATHLFVTRFGFAGRNLMPDLTRLNPASRLKQMPYQNVNSAVQALLLLPLFLYVVYVVVAPRVDEFLVLPLASTQSGTARIGSAVLDLLWKAAAGFLVLGGIDLFRQKSRFQSQMRMTKQEIRDEHKEQEGNPQIKQRIRRLQRDAARRNMMKELPKAAAIVVNPTHYAVALKYELDSMAAPTVIAKGKNYLALRIREKAAEYKIPIVENAPLAQALYKSVDIGQEIPAHLYRAVAEILAYIFRLTQGRARGQG